MITVLKEGKGAEFLNLWLRVHTACATQSPKKELCCLGEKEKGEVLDAMKWQGKGIGRWKVLLLAKGSFLGGLKMGDDQWEMS